MKFTLRVASRYKKDHKKLANTLTKKQKEKLKTAITTLLEGEQLPELYKDHPLTGDWDTYRDCHISPDLLLIYKIINKTKELLLVRLGSHSELF